MPAAPDRSSDHLLSALAAWWRAPRLTGWCALLVAALLFLHKPHALLTPQLYAEDGSIFLSFAEALGWRSMVEPYMGYLHLLPALIAGIASHTLDPAWWPLFYNAVAFALWLAVTLRVFSPRLDWPGKPLLACAFFIGPQTGEVLFNITNLQWLTALLLVQQSLVAPPASWRERLADLGIVAVIGLTGPFSIALWPLFAGRCWRERTRDNAALLALVTACAMIQAWFVWKTGPRFEYPPFAAEKFFAVLGQRLFTLPFLGEYAARALPPLATGLAGVAIITALCAWSLRRKTRGPWQVAAVAGCLAMLAAMIYRSRPDTWAFENLVFADRYFYIPRVLLLWLLAWQWDTPRRGIRWAARGLFLAAALVHLPRYIVPAPPDYHWRQHVDPIRRGVPAMIPTLPEGWTMEYRGRPEGRR